MSPRSDPGVLPVPCLDELSLETLVDHVDRHIDSLSTNEVLDTYFGWLHKQIVKDSFTRDGYLLRQWIASLKNRGFGRDYIWSSFTALQAWAYQQDPASRRRYSMIKVELELGLWNPGSTTAGQQSPQSLEPNDSPKISGPALIVGGGPRITGANDEPVGERKRKRDASPQDFMITETSESQSHTSGNMEASESSANGQSEPRAGMYTPETIYLDSSSPESCGAPGNVDESQTTKKAGDKKKASKSAAPNSLAVCHMSTYVCKRCNQKGKFRALQVCFGACLTLAGHKIQHCPTNMDPKYDKAPDPNYRCDFCKKYGDHFAALCPRNKQPWSLNEQRRAAARAESSNTQTRNKPHNHLNIDSYRPGVCSPLKGVHKESRSKRKSSSAKVAARKSPHSHERHVSKKAKKRHSKVDSQRPERSPRGHGESVHQSRRSDTLAFGSHTDGRLSYENDDVFMIDSSPVPAKMTSTPSGPLEGTLSHFDGLTIHTNSLADGDSPGASEEAEDFLQSLQGQFQDAEHTAVCVAEMELILDEVSKHDEMSHPAVLVDEKGQQWRSVTNPPYDKHVVDLFAGRYLPIINIPVKRRTAADMMEEPGIKASFGGPGCFL